MGPSKTIDLSNSFIFQDDQQFVCFFVHLLLRPFFCLVLACVVFCALSCTVFASFSNVLLFSFSRLGPFCLARAIILPQRRAFGGLISRGEYFRRPWPPPGPPPGRASFPPRPFCTVAAPPPCPACTVWRSFAPHWWFLTDVN